jgi:hypothetical protein
MMADVNAFTKALKEARLAEAVHLDATLDLHDARVLRLEVLRNTMLPQIEGHPDARLLFDLNVQSGEKPRLWLDLISTIEMEPDPKTYRLMQGKEASRECLYETRDPQQMASFALKYLAHRMIAQDKLSTTLNPAVQSQKLSQRYSIWDLVYVWFTGILLGVLGLVAGAMTFGHLKF